MKKMLLMLALLLSPLLASAMNLLPAESDLYFISIKNNSVAETHHFERFSGSLAADGKAVIRVDLASVVTRVDVRDQRMREMLFEVAEFPAAQFSAQIDMAQVKSLAAGDSRRMTLKGELDLHGQKGNLEFDVLVVKRSDGALSVSTVRPAFIQADKYKLLTGVGKLRAAVGLKSIDKVVPVSFYVVFK